MGDCLCVFPFSLLSPPLSHKRQRRVRVSEGARARCAAQSEPSDRRDPSRRATAAARVLKGRPSLPTSLNFLHPPSAAALGAPWTPGPLIGHLSWGGVVIALRTAGAGFASLTPSPDLAFSSDMSFKSFKELGVSAERLGSFCKRWMARVQRSGCSYPPAVSPHNCQPPPSILPSCTPSLFPFLSFIMFYWCCQLTKPGIWLCFCLLR